MTFNLPIHGQVSYYLADDEIPAGMNAEAIPANTMFALYNTGKGQFQLITKKTVINIDATVAQDISQLATFQPQIKEQTMSARKKQGKGILETVLFEADSAIVASETDPVVVPDVSLDQKVDRYLVRYEREAIPTSSMYNTELVAQNNEVPTASTNPSGNNTGGLTSAPPVKENRGLLSSLLFEAPEDEPPIPEEPAAGGGDLFGGGADAGGGGEPSAPKTPPVIDTPKMNMNNYARAVARLINNYEALLDPKTTILARAKEYIRVNYDEATAKMFTEVMEQTYNMTDKPQERDQRMAPNAGNAIYAGGGGGG